MPWFARFDDPIDVPGRPPLRTLAEARGYVLELPKTEKDRPEWQVAMRLLSEAATRVDRNSWIAREAFARAYRRQHRSAFRPAAGQQNPPCPVSRRVPATAF